MTQSIFKDFYDTLCNNLEEYAGEYDEYIDFGPALFKALCDLLKSDIDPALRSPICGAIAYYVTPDDVIPEHRFGPHGYIDDIYLSCYVLKMVSDIHGWDFINQAASRNVKDMVVECESETLTFLKDVEIRRILDYCGI